MNFSNHHLASVQRFQELSFADKRTAKERVRFRRLILSYYQKHGRTLPWRTTPKP